MSSARALMPHAQRGFTLLELLLSLSLTVLLLGLLSAGTYSVISDWQRNNRGLDNQLDQSLALLQLERALIAAFPHSYIDLEQVSRLIYFKGEERELRFVSAVSPQRQGGLTAWRLLSSQRGVLLALTPAYGDNPDSRFETLNPQLLLPGYEARFRYLEQRNPEQKEWLSAWAGDLRQSLPIAVEVVLTPIDTDAGPVLEVVAPVKSYRHEQIEPATVIF